MLLITTLFFTVYNTQKYFVNLVTNYFVVIVELHKEKEKAVVSTHKMEATHVAQWQKQQQCTDKTTSTWRMKSQ